MRNSPKKLSRETHDRLLKTLRDRFEANAKRHPQLAWAQVEKRLESQADRLWPLQEMEQSGGEPDVVGPEGAGGVLTFIDCAAESPKGRRSLCYDRPALDARKENKPANCALDVAAAMGVEVLDEQQYRRLQELGEFDLKTSSWIATPSRIRKLGGALFCDRRYDTVFVYHNGAESYYAARGFRACFQV